METLRIELCPLSSYPLLQHVNERFSHIFVLVVEILHVGRGVMTISTVVVERGGRCGRSGGGRGVVLLKWSCDGRGGCLWGVIVV